MYEPSIQFHPFHQYFTVSERNEKRFREKREKTKPSTPFCIALMSRRTTTHCDAYGMMRRRPKRRGYVRNGNVCDAASVASVGTRVTTTTTTTMGDDDDADADSIVGTTMVFGTRGGAWSASTTTTGGNACGMTTTTEDEDDDAYDELESVESGFVMRFDVDMDWDERVETRVVRSDDRERFSREVNVGSLRDASGDATLNVTSGRISGTVWVPRQTRSAAFDRAMATVNAGEDLFDDEDASASSEIGWHESVVFVVESEDANGEEVRGTIYELSVEYVRGEDYSPEGAVGAAEVESNWTSAFDARAEEERILYERAVETLAEALRETLPAVVDGQDAVVGGTPSGDVIVDPSSAPFAVVWSLLGAFFAVAAVAAYLWRVRARRGGAVVDDDAKKETTTTGDGRDAKQPGVVVSATRTSSKASVEKSMTTANGSLRHRVASSTPIFAHTTALRRKIPRVDSLGFVRAALVSGDDSLVDDADDDAGDVVLDVNRTQDSEEFHQHALDIRDRSKDTSVSEEDSTFDADNSGQFLSAIDEDEIVDITIGNLLDEVAKIHAEVAIASMRAEDTTLDAKRGDFTLIDADEFERYVHIFEKLGGGASSSVYSARWHTKLVALKMLHSMEDGGSAMLGEIEIMRSIDHPSIVKIYGACMEPTCLILQIINGGSLHEILHCSSAAADVRLKESQAVRIARDVASAMTYLHELKPKKIIHRDLKPQNILIEAPSMRAYLADFGVSRVITTSLRTTTTIGAGTVNYMAPELFGDGSVDEKVDVYSFAMIFCEMLTGQVPWKGIHPVRIAALTIDDETGETRPTLPESVSDSTEALIQQCWTYDSRLRPSFRDILSELDRRASL